MLLKKPKAKQFDYTPRFYDPEKDTEEKRKKRLRFRSARNFRKKGRNPVYWLIIVIVILFIYLKLLGYL